MWGGLVSHNGSAFPDVAKTFINFAQTSNPDPLAHVIAAASFIQGMEVAVANFYHAKPQPDPPSLAPFVAIQPQLMSTVRDDSLLGFSVEQSSFSPDGARSWFFTTTWQADLDFMLSVCALGAEAVAPLSASVPGFVLAKAFQPLTKWLLTASAAAGGNTLGLTPNDGPLIVNMLQTLHTNAADNDKVFSAMLALNTSIKDLAVEKGKFNKYKFINYGHKILGL